MTGTPEQRASGRAAMSMRWHGKPDASAETELIQLQVEKVIAKAAARGVTLADEQVERIRRILAVEVSEAVQRAVEAAPEALTAEQRQAVQSIYAPVSARVADGAA